MVTTDTAIQGEARTIAIDRVHVPDNVRALDQAHVDALAGSIALQGQIVPVIVRADGENYVLVAGFHRYAAACQLGLSEITYELRDGETEDADRAVENITRKQLNPHEEALAVQAMLQRGLTQDGAAQALGWSRAKVSARVKLLELPDRAQEMVGAGRIQSAASSSCARSAESRRRSLTL